MMAQSRIVGDAKEGLAWLKAFRSHGPAGKPPARHPRRVPVRKSAEHAPKGGISIGGKDFRGGEFIPAEDLANATPDEKAELEAKKQDKPASDSGRPRVSDDMTPDEIAGHVDAVTSGPTQYTPDELYQLSKQVPAEGGGRRRILHELASHEDSVAEKLKRGEEVHADVMDHYPHLTPKPTDAGRAEIPHADPPTPEPEKPAKSGEQLMSEYHAVLRQKGGKRVDHYRAIIDHLNKLTPAEEKLMDAELLKQFGADGPTVARYRETYPQSLKREEHLLRARQKKRAGGKPSAPAKVDAADVGRRAMAAVQAALGAVGKGRTDTSAVNAAHQELAALKTADLKRALVEVGAGEGFVSKATRKQLERSAYEWTVGRVGQRIRAEQ